MLKLLNTWYADSEKENKNDEIDKLEDSSILDRQNRTAQEKIWEVVEAIPFFIAVALLVCLFYNMANLLSGHVEQLLGK